MQQMNSNFKAFFFFLAPVSSINWDKLSAGTSDKLNDTYSTQKTEKHSFD